MTADVVELGAVFISSLSTTVPEIQPFKSHFLYLGTIK